MRILIVDDSKLNRALAANYIAESDLPLEIIQAQSGEEAMLVLQTVEIDIVLLDIIMPGIDGVEVLKRLKTNDAYADIKVIMFTTLQEKELLQNCFDLGASDFIQKPIENIEFIARIKSIMRQRKLELEQMAYIKEIENQQHIIQETNIQLMQQEKMAGVGQLAAGVAHEINNPLGFIASNFLMLREYIDKFVKYYEITSGDNPFDAINDGKAFATEEDFNYIIEDIDELFEETNIGVDRVTQIVKSLRNFSRIDAPDAFDAYDVNEGLKDTLIIANNHTKYSADVSVEYGEVKEVYGIGSEINQVFLNMLVNGVYAIKEKHIEEMGEIQIKTYGEDDFVVVSIRDNGKGMDEKTRTSLFNPFFTTKPVGEGTGLGLSISYDIIVNKHKGKIEVESEVGVGTEFKIYLPTEKQE
jgi:signal transduction histidine kinase